MAKLSSVDRARDRARVIDHLEAGWKQQDVAVLLGVRYPIQTAAPIQGYT